MQKIAEKKITLIIGKRGSGKSYLTQKLIAQEDRIVVYDVMSEYTNGVIFDEDSYEQFLAFWRHVHRGRFRIIYRPVDPQKEIEQIAQFVYALGNVTFVVEEIDSCCGTHGMTHTFHAIIQRGRHKNIQLIGVTPAPFGINRNLTRQAKEIYIFNTNEPRDRQYLAELLGSDIVSSLDKLKQYEFVRWQDGRDGFAIGKG